MCNNTDCPNGGTFIPHDRRQVFCEDQCRINYHNDRRYEENNSIFQNEKALRGNERKLKEIYWRFVDGSRYCVVPKVVLYAAKVNVMLLTRELINNDTGGTVKWYYSVGIEIHPQNDNYYIIHINSKMYELS